MKKMMMSLRIGLAALLTVFSPQTNAQTDTLTKNKANWFEYKEKQDFPWEGSLILLYRIPVDSVYKIVYQDKPISFDAAWMQKPTYAVPRLKLDSLLGTDITPAYYVTADAVQEYIRLSIREKRAFSSSIADLRDLRLLDIRDPQGKPMADVRVIQREKPIPYNELLRGYILQPVQNELIELRSGEYVQYYNATKKRIYYNNHNYNYSNQPRDRNTDYRGYLVTNQPLYRRGDTVKYKAYLLHPHEESTVNEQVQVELRVEYGQSFKIHELKPEGPGVYFSEFVLGDSIETDQAFQLVITGKGSKNTISQTLMVEDYLLDETRMRVTRDNTPVYHPGDSVHIYAFAYNSIGLPVLDGTIYTTVRLNTYQHRADTPVFVPDTLYTSATPVAADGQTYIGFPTAHFAFLHDASLICNVTMVNSNFERKDTSFNIRYAASGKYLQVYESGDQIFASAMRNKKSVPARGHLTINGIKKEIAYPFQAKLDEMSSSYFFELMDDTGGRASYEYYNTRFDSLSVYDDYRGNTAYFTVLNPKKVNFRYALYEGDEMITYGAISKDTVFRVYSRKEKTVTMMVNYRWNGASYHHNFVAPKYYKRMLIGLTKKDMVFPGQQDSIGIDLKDVDGKGIAKTNITVLAYTSKFKDEFIPAMQYAGYLKPGMEPPTFARNITQQSYNSGRYILITPQNAHIAAADTVFFYRNIYLNPLHRASYLFEIPGSAAPQLAIYLCQGGRYITPEAIYVDGVPAYLRMLNVTTDPDALFVSPGEHNLQVRTHNARYSIGTVIACAGMKTNLFVNLDSSLKKPTGNYSYRTVYKDTMPDSLTDEERHVWGRHMIMYRSEYGRGYGLMQGLHDYRAAGAGHPYNYNLKGRDYYQPHDIVTMGPLNMNDSVAFFQPLNVKMKFMPELHFIYTLRPGMMRLERKSALDYLTRKLQYSAQIPRMNHVAPAPVSYDSLQVLPPAKPDEPGVPSRSISIRGDLIYPSQYHARLLVHYNGYTPTHLIVRSLTDTAVYAFTAQNGSYYNLPTGTYELTFLWADTAQSIIEKLELRDGGMTYVGAPKNRQPFNIMTAAKWLKRRATIYHNNAIADVTFSTYDYTGEKGKGQVIGAVYDIIGEPVLGAVIQLMQNGRTIVSATTDKNGKFSTKAILPDLYEVKITYSGYKEIQLKDVEVAAGKATHIVAKMKQTAPGVNEVVVRSYKVPLVNKYSPGSVTTRTAEEIEKMPTRSVEGVAMTSPGVLSLQGAREESSLYYVDGVQVRGGANGMVQGMIDGRTELVGANIGRRGLKPDAKQFMTDFLNNMQAASGMRQQFRDWAIWEPNLWTDKQGHTSFSVRYPDDMTTWKTYVLAMNEKGFSGKTLRVTRAFKPLAAELSVPRFLRYGDSVEVVGKVMNYTAQPFRISTRFAIQGIQTVSDTATVANGRVQQLSLAAPAKNSTDTNILTGTYMLQAENGYQDGEERKIPVYPVGLIENKGDFFLMNRDTTVQSKPTDSAGYFTGRTTIYVDGSMLEVMLREIEQLKVYPHGCTEQLTTKLLAIYYEEEIKRLLGNKEFNNTKEKKQILEKLIQAQNRDGSFGWFYNNARDIRVTNYVISTMMKVNKDGWLDYIIRKGLTHLDINLANMDGENLLASLSTLSAAGYASNYRTHLERLDFNSQHLYNRATIVKIKKEQKLPYRKELDTLMGQAREGVRQLYWNGSRYDWYRDDLATTLVMYQVINDDIVYGHRKDEIVQYLLFKRGKGSYGNTAESGLVLTTLLPSMLRESGAKPGKVTEVYLSGTLKDTVRKFPATFRINDKHPAIQVQKKGFSPAFVSVSYEYFNMQPKERSGSFKVSTIYLKDGQQTYSILKQGDKIVLRTTVTCTKDAEYVMVDIPIPAGCVHGEKDPYNRTWIESSRERFKDRAVIYCGTMPKGTHTFDVPLQVRYKGSFNVNPASASMMYYPEEYGNEVTKKVIVK